MALTTAATRVLPAGMAVLPDDPDAVAIAAPAKLNLSLAILARRSDGFHEI